jgi:acyl-homoserine-lactone acylase
MRRHPPSWWQTEVDITQACDVLGDWDGRLDIDSVGAVVWREFLGSLPAGAFTDAGPLFAEPFDVDDPVATPHTLAAAPAEGADPVLVALARAVIRLADNAIALDTPLGDVQFTRKGDAEIPIHGGLSSPEGAFNVVDYRAGLNSTIPDMPRGTVVNGPTGLASDGYVINAGTNIAMMVEFTADGPHAMAVFSRSQSDDPDSPHFTDQTELFSAEGWRPVLFTEEEIAADPELEITEVSGTW